MTVQTVFKRYELKYLLDEKQRDAVFSAMGPYMRPDEYGETTIRNVYLDTENYRLVRRSIERPDYKEKLRVRSYCTASRDSSVFVELKKKYDSVVYKRRIILPHDKAVDWVSGRAYCPKDTQISREIDYFLSYYGALRPAVFLSYDRRAFFSPEGGGFRMTFDTNIKSRIDELTLISEAYGTSLLPDGVTLLECKCGGGLPLWLVHVLTKEHIFKTSFSKYGAAYEKLICPHLKGKERFLHA